MFKALSEGHRKFRRVAVVADTDAPTPPCGACRQILWEFGGDLEVILANLRRETGRHQLKDLLPLPFDARLALRVDATGRLRPDSTPAPRLDIIDHECCRRSNGKTTRS